MQILPCSNLYELRDWLNWCRPRTAEVQICCLSPSAIRSLYVAFCCCRTCSTQQLHGNGFVTVGSTRCSVLFIPFQIINCFISVISMVCWLYFTMILPLVSLVLLHTVHCRCILTMYAPDIVRIHTRFWLCVCDVKYSLVWLQFT